MENTLTAEQIEDRLSIAWGVDAQECEGCGKALPDGVASDPMWWIDSILTRGEDGGPVAHAQIRCPECW